jgi:membrane-associated phospholipid phosphatase
VDVTGGRGDERGAEGEKERPGEERTGDGATARPGDRHSSSSLGALGRNARDVSPRTRSLAPVDKVVIAYLAIITAFILIFSYRIEDWPWLCAAQAIGIGFVALISRLDRTTRAGVSSPSPQIAPSPRLPVSPSPASLGRGIAHFIHAWYPVALIPLTYKELSYLIPRIHPRDFDAALAAIDYRVFGVHPTVWLERFTWPALTELLQLCYPTYYFLPIILGAVIWRSGNAERYRFWVFVVAFGFYLSYLGYIAVPAIGPRFLPEILDSQTRPLTGVWLFQTVRDVLDRAEGLTRDCFPSGHTEMTLLALYYARLFHRRTFWFFLPVGVAIIASTVYLRYHYVVDVVAGALLAGLVIMRARKLFDVLGGDDRVALDM